MLAKLPFFSVLLTIVAAVIRVFYPANPSNLDHFTSDQIRALSEARLIEATFILIAGIFGALMLALALQLRDKDQQFSVDRKWGALGGSATGYTVTAPVAVLAGSAACLLALVTLGYATAMRKDDRKQDTVITQPSGSSQTISVTSPQSTSVTPPAPTPTPIIKTVKKPPAPLSCSTVPDCPKAVTP